MKSSEWIGTSSRTFRGKDGFLCCALKSTPVPDKKTTTTKTDPNYSKIFSDPQEWIYTYEECPCTSRPAVSSPS
jgi:hypothetical protein